jgi:C_GCAxxG_C_C family probable redox protein
MVKDHLTEALELFRSGFHCSQAVFAVFSDELGLPHDTALKIACPFGGGIGGYGKTCGALTGAIMVIGLKYGSSVATDIQAKNQSREKTRELMKAFETAHGSFNCNDLVGFDRSNFTGAELLVRLPYFHSTCPKFLETVISFLEEEF